MEKVIRDGKVAVLYSPGFGAGWYSWHKDYPQLLFHPELVKMVEENRREEITDEFCEQLLGLTEESGGVYTGGAGNLRIAWLPEGTHFDIHEYDGSESIQTFEDIKLIA